MRLENGKHYLVNGTDCLYDQGFFFWQDGDGTKWFRATSLSPDTEIETYDEVLK